MTRHLLLFGMIVCYLFPIFYIYIHYDPVCNGSISSLVSNQPAILGSMIFMGGFTWMYEMQRNDCYSTLIISILLMSIYGLLIYDETNAIHYFFAISVFLMILLFQLYHCIQRLYSHILILSFMVSVGLLNLLLVYMSSNDIFYLESCYILNFAFFYLYMHMKESATPDADLNLVVDTNCNWKKIDIDSYKNIENTISLYYNNRSESK